MYEDQISQIRSYIDTHAKEGILDDAGATGFLALIAEISPGIRTEDIVDFVEQIVKLFPDVHTAPKDNTNWIEDLGLN